VVGVTFRVVQARESAEAGHLYTPSTPSRQAANLAVDWARIIFGSISATRRPQPANSLSFDHRHIGLINENRPSLSTRTKWPVIGFSGKVKRLTNMKEAFDTAWGTYSAIDL
jgi:hypothetical protein